MMETLAKRGEIEIRIGNVDLATKLDALGAALAAVREAHREQISPTAWAALHRAQENIAEAMMYSSDGGRRLTQPKEAVCAERNALGCNPRTTPAGEPIAPAGTGAVDV